MASKRDGRSSAPARVVHWSVDNTMPAQCGSMDRANTVFMAVENVNCPVCLAALSDFFTAMETDKKEIETKDGPLLETRPG